MQQPFYKNAPQWYVWLKIKGVSEPKAHALMAWSYIGLHSQNCSLCPKMTATKAVSEVTRKSIDSGV
eukprot:2574215-Amphidinium_carterae.1